jgi:hypothetical protein
MATPKGFKQFHRTLANGDKVFIYSNQHSLILQLRREVPTEENILEPSFKVAVALSPVDALLIASELLDAAAPRLTETMPSKVETPLLEGLVQESE